MRIEKRAAAQKGRGTKRHPVANSNLSVSLSCFGMPKLGLAWNGRIELREKLRVRGRKRQRDRETERERDSEIQRVIDRYTQKHRQRQTKRRDGLKKDN